MLSGEATNTNFVVCGLTRSGLEPTIYRTRSEQANCYTTDVYNIKPIMEKIQKIQKKFGGGGGDNFSSNYRPVLKNDNIEYGR